MMRTDKDGVPKVVQRILADCTRHTLEVVYFDGCAESVPFDVLPVSWTSPAKEREKRMGFTDYELSIVEGYLSVKYVRRQRAKALARYTATA